MLPGPRLFRSRWAALLWAGGIVWAVADLAPGLRDTQPPPHAGSTPRPSAPATAPTPDPDPDPDVAALVAALH